MNDVEVIEVLRTKGPLTLEALEREAGSGMLGWLQRMKARGVVHQPKKLYWAVSTREELYLNMLRASRARGFMVLDEEIDAAKAAVDKTKVA